MKVRSFISGYLKLDGGSMFGIVPKKIWQKLNPPDEQNMCTWAMRHLLIEVDDRMILLDTGMGYWPDDAFLQLFSPRGQEALDHQLQNLGISHASITDVLITHLHFDHAGGCFQSNGQGNKIPAFPNARYWVNQTHWNWALQPNEREKASFLPTLFKDLDALGILHFIEESNETQWLDKISIRFSQGHTTSMMIPVIRGPEHTYVYCADMIPSSYHIGLPYIMAYDIRPLDTLKEKTELLEEAAQNNYILVFEHDPHLAACTVVKNATGKFQIDKKWEVI